MQKYQIQMAEVMKYMKEYMDLIKAQLYIFLIKPANQRMVVK